MLEFCQGLLPPPHLHEGTSSRVGGAKDKPPPPSSPSPPICGIFSISVLKSMNNFPFQRPRTKTTTFSPYISKLFRSCKIHDVDKVLKPGSETIFGVENNRNKSLQNQKQVLKIKTSTSSPPSPSGWGPRPSLLPPLHHHHQVGPQGQASSLLLTYKRGLPSSRC